MTITELTPLARGGMAELHLGRMRGVAGVETTVVVKRILPTLLERQDFVEMFVSEARIAATLQHPNIVQTYQVGEDHDGYYIAMEYLQGADLRQVTRQLRQSGQGFPSELALQMCIGMLAGLHYAHTRTRPDGTPAEIVHRDVSPHNTFVTWDGAVKLLDFGVAKASGNLSSDTDVVQGKLRYMAPEQCLNAVVDARSDVYSTGVMLYEMLTGHRAHPGKERATIQANLLDHPVPDPTTHGVHLPEDLHRIVMKAVRKKRGERFQTARQFLDALEDYCQANGIFPSASRLGEWARELVPEPQRRTRNRTGAITKERLTETKLTSTVHAQLRQIGGVTIAHLRGRLNESFDGRAIGEQLDGPTVLDLEAIERITSFGIRAWLDMLRVSSARPLYLARVPDGFVNQIAMVRGLLGDGKVCSFSVPILDDNSVSSTLELSGTAGVAFLADGTLPSGTLDDDLEVYAVLRDSFEPSPPPNIAGAIRELDALDDLPPIEKRLDHDRTTFVVRRSLDGGLRWKRLLDGLEGEVTFDFTAVVETSDEGITAFVRALRRVAPDLRDVTFRSPNLATWTALHNHLELRRQLALDSLMVAASCAQSACPDHGLRRRSAALVEDTRLVLPSCRSCGDTMVSTELDAVPGFVEVAEVPAVISEEARSGCVGQLLGWFRRAGSSV